MDYTGIDFDVDVVIADVYGYLCVSASTYICMRVNECRDFTAGLSGINLSLLGTIWILSTV